MEHHTADGTLHNGYGNPASRLVARAWATSKKTATSITHGREADEKHGAQRFVLRFRDDLSTFGLQLRGRFTPASATDEPSRGTVTRLSGSSSPRALRKRMWWTSSAVARPHCWHLQPSLSSTLLRSSR